MNPYRHENKVILNYIYDLYEQGHSIEEIARLCKTQVWCIQNLFILANI